MHPFPGRQTARWRLMWHTRAETWTSLQCQREDLHIWMQGSTWPSTPSWRNLKTDQTRTAIAHRTAARRALTCRAEPPQNRPWPGWSPGGRRCGSRSCNTPAQSRPAARLCAASPLCISPSPGGSQCGCNSESGGLNDWENNQKHSDLRVIFLVASLQKSVDSLHNTYWPTETRQTSETTSISNNGMFLIASLAYVNSWQNSHHIIQIMRLC